MAGIQWYCVARHYVQIPAIIDVMASYSSAPLVMTSAGQLMYGSVLQWEYFHVDCMAWWSIAQSCTWHINVSYFHYQNSGPYHCVYMQEYQKHKAICPLVFSQ